MPTASSQGARTAWPRRMSIQIVNVRWSSLLTTTTTFAPTPVYHRTIHHDHGYSTPYMHCVVRDLVSGNLKACLFGVLRTVRGGEGVACPSVGRLDSRQVSPTGRIPPTCGVHSGAPTHVKHRVGKVASSQYLPPQALMSHPPADYPVVPVSRGKHGKVGATYSTSCTAGHKQPHQLTTPRP